MLERRIQSLALERLSPVQYRAQAVQRGRGSFDVVPVDVVHNRPFEGGDRGKALQEQFAFQVSEEAFDHGIVQAIALARHALRDGLFFQ